ncbi:hypothetical protein ABT024_27620 [Streptomyces sp. NPDC002812]|uniref:hypothetical protein n=1 Tax=Streptomyces sp. NPDC002812 TaxID=3154434 RepID=UPI00332C07ED
MQPLRALRRARAVVAGIVAVLLLACGGLFTHPASAMPAPAGLPGSPATAGAPATAGSPRMAGTAGTRAAAGMHGSPAMAGMAMGAGPDTRMDLPALGAVAPEGMAAGPDTGPGPATGPRAAAGAAMGAGSGGGCSVAGQECPLASAYAPTVAAGPVGELSGSVAGGTQAAAGGHPGPVPPPECSRPRAPDLDSLCVSRT